MDRKTLGRKLLMFVLLAYLVLLAGNDIVGYWDPTAKVPFGRRVGKDGSHAHEKLATGLLAYAIGIVGTGLALRRQRPILAFNLIGTCYLLWGVRDEVFYVWEGGRPFDKDHLTPWVFLMLSLPMFWTAHKEQRERDEALAALEEVERPSAGRPA